MQSANACWSCCASAPLNRLHLLAEWQGSISAGQQAKLLAQFPHVRRGGEEELQAYIDVRTVSTKKKKKSNIPSRNAFPEHAEESPKVHLPIDFLEWEVTRGKWVSSSQNTLWSVWVCTSSSPTFVCFIHLLLPHIWLWIESILLELHSELFKLKCLNKACHYRKDVEGITFPSCLASPFPPPCTSDPRSSSDANRESSKQQLLFPCFSCWAASMWEMKNGLTLVLLSSDTLIEDGFPHPAQPRRKDRQKMKKGLCGSLILPAPATMPG